jgi:hypothetical protein
MVLMLLLRLPLLPLLLLLLAHQYGFAWCYEALLFCCINHAVRDAVLYTACTAAMATTATAAVKSATDAPEALEWQVTKGIYSLVSESQKHSKFAVLLTFAMLTIALQATHMLMWYNGSK